MIEALEPSFQDGGLGARLRRTGRQSSRERREIDRGGARAQDEQATWARRPAAVLGELGVGEEGLVAGPAGWREPRRVCDDEVVSAFRVDERAACIFLP